MSAKSSRKRSPAPSQKQKLFRIDANLAAIFEAWCQTRGIKQEQAAEAALFQLIATPAQQREDLFVALAKMKAKMASEPATASDVGAAVAAALARPKAKAPAKRRQGRQSA